MMKDTFTMMNDHAEIARSLISDTGELGGSERIIALAQVHATLALAYATATR